jgi:hypothetical protein
MQGGGTEGEESCREEQREGSHARRGRKEKGVMQEDKREGVMQEGWQRRGRHVGRGGRKGRRGHILSP